MDSFMVTDVIIRTNIQEMPPRWWNIRGRDQHRSADMDSLTQNDKVFIYCLVDPRDNSIFYVGKTVDPKRRLRHHLKYQKGFPKSKYIEDLLSIDVTPRMEILEVVSSENWEERERYYVSLYRANGANLTNVGPGGGYYPDWTGKHHKEETKKKISKLNKGRRFSVFTRLLMSLAAKRRGNNFPSKKGVRPVNARKVYAYTLSGEFVGLFNSTREAGDFAGVDQSVVSRCCTGKISRAGKYVFRYEKRRG